MRYLAGAGVNRAESKCLCSVRNFGEQLPGDSEATEGGGHA